MIFAPRGRAHGFSNPSDVDASYMAVITPSGYEAYFEQVAHHVRRTGGLPDPASADEWMAALHTRRAPPIER